MGKVAKWIVTLIVGASASTIVFLATLQFAATNTYRWPLAATFAVAALAASTVIGSTWVNHSSSAAPTGLGNQTVSNTKVKSRSGPAAGIMGDVYVNSDPPARRKAGRSSRRRPS